MGRLLLKRSCTFLFLGAVQDMHSGGCARSKYASAMELEHLETHATNPKHKKEVCRYWLRGRCMKDDACEFLHAIDYSKMPMCSAGDTCAFIGTCQFKHPSTDRPICANYQVGFCSFGNRCAYRHVQCEGPPPEISAYWGPEYEALKRDASMAGRRNWRTKVCEYYVANGWCPYFDMCNFSHSAFVESNS